MRQGDFTEHEWDHDITCDCYEQMREAVERPPFVIRLLRQLCKRSTET
jgi:hypothetical protein